MPELSDLLVDRGQLDQELLANTLGPFVGIDGNRHEIVPGEGWTSLGGPGLVIAVLLGRKAMMTLELGVEVEGLPTKELEESTGLKGNTIRPTLSRLKDQGLVRQDAQGRYYIPTASVPRACEVITGGSNGQSGSRRRTSRSGRGRKSSK